MNYKKEFIKRKRAELNRLLLLFGATRVKSVVAECPMNFVHMVSARLVLDQYNRVLCTSFKKGRGKRVLVTQTTI